MKKSPRIIDWKRVAQERQRTIHSLLFRLSEIDTRLILLIEKELGKHLHAHCLMSVSSPNWWRVQAIAKGVAAGITKFERNAKR
jgi:hypothetical protein